MGTRRRARECALQLLFQYDITQISTFELFDLYWSELGNEKQEIQKFATALVTGVLEHIGKLDGLIRQRTEHWRISRMAIVDRNLLRLAVYEFLFEADTPKTVVINEALEIARRFSTYEATQFINGILDGIKHDLEINTEKLEDSNDTVASAVTTSNV